MNKRIIYSQIENIFRKVDDLCKIIKNQKVFIEKFKMYNNNNIN